MKVASNYVYEYFIKDHLGNTRAAFDAGTSGFTLVQRNDYYPFGMILDASIPNNDNKYLYNWKELQDDNINSTAINWYDYGARFYDPQIGRWTTPDPLAEKNRRWSPYNYCVDNPLRFIDPNGMDWYEDKNGNTMWQKGSKNVEGYKNIGSSYSYTQGNTTITYNQSEAKTIKETVLSPSDFKTSQTTTADGKKKQCYTAAKEMVAESGATVKGGGKAVSVVTAQESNTKSTHTVSSTGKTQQGIDYINSQMDQGFSVAIGVDYKAGNGGGNDDNVTDHFVALSARITDVKTQSTSYQFFDPGTSYQDKGTNESNVFSKSGGMLKGTTYYSGTVYTVSQIRENE